MNVKSLAAVTILFVGLVFVIGANTGHKLSGGYVNTAYFSTSPADGNAVWYMSSSAAGSTQVVTDRKMGKNWRFRMKGSGTIHVFSPAHTGWNGDFADTTNASPNYLKVALNQGQVWQSEGLPIYAFRQKSGTGLQVIARD